MSKPSRQVLESVRSAFRSGSSLIELLALVVAIALPAAILAPQTTQAASHRAAAVPQSAFRLASFTQDDKIGARKPTGGMKQYDCYSGCYAKYYNCIVAGTPQSTCAARYNTCVAYCR